MVRESKLLILDEATSAIGTPESIAYSLSVTYTLSKDYKTDAIIQESLRTGLQKDVTVLTVAHRLHSIMDSDKIVSRR